MNIPSIVIEQRFGDRNVLFDYDYDYDYDYEYRLAPEYECEYEYEYGVVDFHRGRVLKTDWKTHHDRLSETEPLMAFRERRQRQRTGFGELRTKAMQTLSCARGSPLSRLRATASPRAAFGRRSPRPERSRRWMRGRHSRRRKRESAELESVEL